MTCHTTSRRTYFFYYLLTKEVEKWKSRWSRLFYSNLIPNSINNKKFILTLLIACLPYIDMLLDFSVAWDYYRKELYLFTGLTLAFILVGKFVSLVFTLIQTGLEEGESRYSCIMNNVFAKRWTSLRKICKHGLSCRRAWRDNRPTDQVYEYNMMLDKMQELQGLGYLILFTENLPQTILQTVLVMEKMTSSPSPLVEHVLPILKIIFGSLSLGYGLKNGYENELIRDGYFMEWAHSIVFTIRNSLFTFSRMLTISLLALTSWIVLLIGILVHWTLYSVYCMSFFSDAKQVEILTSFFQGLFLVAFFKRMNLTLLSKHDATAYFVIYSVENIAGVFYWYSMNQLESHRTFLVCVSTASSILGLFFHFVYIWALSIPKHYSSLSIKCKEDDPSNENILTDYKFRAPNIKSVLEELAASSFTITDILRFNLHEPNLTLYAKDYHTFVKLHNTVGQIASLQGKIVEILTDRYSPTHIKISIYLWEINQNTITQVMTTLKNENKDYDVQSWELVGHRTSTEKIILYFNEKSINYIGKLSMKYPSAKIKVKRIEGTGPATELQGFATEGAHERLIRNLALVRIT